MSAPLIRCRAGTHRVRLDPARWWQPARCPACRTPLDPLRVQRLWRWLQGGVPGSGPRLRGVRLPPQAVPSVASVAYALGTWAAFSWLGDRTWIGTALLFTGRWIWLLPVLALAALTAIGGRRWMPGPLLAAVLVLHGVMGFRTGWRTLLPAPAGRPLRVMTFNVEGGDRVGVRLAELLNAERPDVVALQECGPGIRQAFMTLEGFVVDTTQGCFASRFPIEQIRLMPVAQFDRLGGLLVTTYVVRTPAGRVGITNVHLETPRKGLVYLLSPGERSAPGAIRDNTLLRDLQSRQARAWVNALGLPVIVTGDFNLPVDSRIFRDHWGDLADAWETAGRGFGWTKRNGWISVRIDHVLADRTFRITRARVGGDYGSDHLPVIAELHRVK